MRFDIFNKLLWYGILCSLNKLNFKKEEHKLATARVKVEEKVHKKLAKHSVLWLQWCTYEYDDRNSEQGYRFIYSDENGKLRPQRGQARIPSLKIAQELIDKAKRKGWGDNCGAPLV